MPSEGKRAALVEGKGIQAFCMCFGLRGGEQGFQPILPFFIEAERYIEAAGQHGNDDLPAQDGFMRAGSVLWLEKR